MVPHDTIPHDTIPHDTIPHDTIDRSSASGNVPRPTGERIAIGALLLWLGAMVFLTVRPFVSPLAWAVLVAYVTWPLFARLHRTISNRDVAALTMVCAVAAVSGGIGYGLSLLFQTQIIGTFDDLEIGSLSKKADVLIEALGRLPWIGAALAETARGALNDPGRILVQAGDWLRQWLGSELVAVAGGIGSIFIKIGIALLAMYFLYREGVAWWGDVRRALQRVFGEHSRAYIAGVTNTVDAVVYGLVVGAAVQGLAAGIGYWIFGAPAPLLLGVLTGVLAIVPYGAALVVAPVVLWLALTGATWAALGLVLWAVVVVGLADNVARPLLISRVGRVHLLLVTVGIVGGLAAFGSVGIFLGPAVLAVVLTVWRQWLEDSRSQV